MTISYADYWSSEIKKMHGLLAEVGLHMGEGGVVEVNGVAVKFSDRLDKLEQQVKRLGKG